MLFLIGLTILFLNSLREEKFRKGFIKSLRYIILIGVIGSILPIYPALAIGLYAYFLYEIYRAIREKSIRLNIELRYLLIIPLFVFSFLSDYDAMTYFIPASYGLIKHGGIYASIGYFEPQNPGMSSIAAFLLFFDFFLDTPTQYYIYSLRLINALAFIAILDLVNEFVDPKKFLIAFLPIPVFMHYTIYRSSYADLLVAFLVLAFVYSIYREEEQENLGYIFSTLALVKYVRPFIILAALILYLVPKKLYPTFYAIPIVSLLHGDFYGFIFLSLIAFGLISLEPIERLDVMKIAKDLSMLPAYLRRLRETILFGRIFGEYGGFGLLMSQHFLRPKRFNFVAERLSVVRENIEAIALTRITSLVLGPVLIGSIYFLSILHAPLGSFKASREESFMILAGLIQIAVTYSPVSRQYLYLALALAMVIARADLYILVPFFSAYYAYIYMNFKFTIKPILVDQGLTLLLVFEYIAASLFIFKFIPKISKAINAHRSLFALIFIASLIGPGTYYYKLYSIGNLESKRTSTIQELSNYLNNHLPKGSLVIETLVWGLGTYLKDYTVMNVFDTASWHGFEKAIEDPNVAMEVLKKFPAVAVIVPSYREHTQYIAFIYSALSIALVAVAISSADEAKDFGLYKVLIAHSINFGPMMLAYRLYGTFYNILINPNIHLVAPSFLDYSVFVAIIGNHVSNAKFYYYISGLEGGMLVSVNATIIKVGSIYVAYTVKIENYNPVGFSVEVDGKNYTLGVTP